MSEPRSKVRERSPHLILSSPLLRHSEMTIPRSMFLYNRPCPHAMSAFLSGGGVDCGPTTVLKTVSGRLERDASVYQDRLISKPNIAGPSRVRQGLSLGSMTRLTVYRYSEHLYSLPSPTRLQTPSILIRSSNTSSLHLDHL